LFDAPIEQISCGGNHTALLTKSNMLFVAGRNDSGQLGLQVRIYLFFCRLLTLYILEFLDQKYIPESGYYLSYKINLLWI
jgi:alpha-tubulin suppressor-like RCC1 family protein